MGKRWSQEEAALLRSLCESGVPLTDRMSLFPGRTYDAVKAYASKAGIESIGQCLWTPEEDEILRQIYESPCSIKSRLHLLPRRSHCAVKARAQRLELDTKAAAVEESKSWILPILLKTLISPSSADEIATTASVNRKSVQNLLDRYRGVHFRVAEWRKTDSNHTVMLWMVGNEPDAPKPAPKSMKQANKEYRERQKIAKGLIDPFAVAAGRIAVPQAPPGRIFQQSMSVSDDERVTS